jgi:Flp pilus assembly protein TadB
MSQFLEAVDQLNDRLIAAHAIGEALDLAGGETAPAWVHVFRTQIEAIREAAEALETLVRRSEHVQA